MAYDASFDQSPAYAPAIGMGGNIDTPTMNWYRGEIRRRLSRLLMGGTEAMRVAAGSGGPVAYISSNVQNPQEIGTLRAMPSVLPIEKGETQEEYTTRRDRSVLFSYFKDAIDEHVGRAFHQPPQLLDDVPTFIRGDIQHTEILVDDEDNPGQKKPIKKTKKIATGIWENIDNQGNHGDVFGRALWAAAEIDGITFVLVERTPGPRDQAGAPLAQSVADRKATDGRVYWVHLLAEDCIEITPRMYNGAPRLSVWRHRERMVLARGAVVHRVRKFIDGLHPGEYSDPRQANFIPPDNPSRLARWELYEEPDEVRTMADQTKREQQGWGPPIEQGYLSLPFIPIVPFFFGDKIDFWQADPAAKGLAEANGVHYRVYSDYLDLLHAACVPMLHRSGWSPSMTDPSNPQNVVSSKRLLWTMDPAGRAEWVEVRGSSLQRIEASLDRIEARCQVLSLEPLLQRLGTPTATAEGLKAAKANSRIEAWMVLYKDSMELCLDYSAQYEGMPEDSGGSVSTNKDLGLFILGGVDFNLLLALNAAGKIDDGTLLFEAKRRGILHMDADIDDIKRLARIEQQNAASRMRGTALPLGQQPPNATAQTEEKASQPPPIPPGEGEARGARAPVG